MPINISNHVNSSTRTCQQGDWFFKFDYTSGRHHVEIFQNKQSSLAAPGWLIVPISFFKFTVLPFSLSVGPFIFTKTQKALMKHWRRQAIRLFTYLDDGVHRGRF